ncbi:polyketide synthase [Xylariaceae sp. FL0016]|nr:polyketide synthase [Xylariaceae sp. FL0016]
MSEPIAIVGIDARFPGDSDTAEKFYDFLLAGRSARTEVPRDRYDVDALWHPDPERSGATRVRHGHFLKDSISAFDAPFFSITPKEASAIDPQQRGILESVYRALENAGIPLSEAAGTQTGVYVGCFSADYKIIAEKDMNEDLKYSATGNVVSMLSNRVSWFYDFRGPSMTIDTACSSSLVAAHQACNSLRLRETSMAIVGGCNLILTPEFSMALDKGGVLGPDGKCQSFDAKGNGYARGEGFGTVILKRISDCIRDGDTIRAVIRNSGSNQDGRSPGITQPTSIAHANLMRQVYSRASLDPSLTRFFEAHGTGTSIGDPVETSAIADIFASHRSRSEPLYVGALKSNIGHTEGAAGVAALIKGVLTLENGIIPANTWLETLNPKIKDSWNLAFPTQALGWPQSGLRRMSINSFVLLFEKANHIYQGVGGANAHVVMDDALHFLKQYHLVGNHRTTATPQLDQRSIMLANDMNLANGDHPQSDEVNGVNGTSPSSDLQVERPKSDQLEKRESPQLLVWSSFDQDGVSRAISSYNEYLDFASPRAAKKMHDPKFFKDLSYTVTQRRTHHSWRSYSIARAPSGLKDALQSTAIPTRAMNEPRLAFVFTGQGAQWATMGKELMSYNVFQQSIHDADKYFGEMHCPWSLMYELFKEKGASRINEAEFSQPLCTALQVALVELLVSWNVYPHAVAGHSSGEIAAAYAAGIISRESAWRIAYHRGNLCARLAQSTTQPKTGMIAVALSESETLDSIERVNAMMPDGTLEIACFNSPESHTVSGDLANIDALADFLANERVFARKLNVEMAYHSRHMKAIYDEYVESVGHIEIGSEASAHRTRFFSSTLGAITSPNTLQSPSYFADNMVSPVRFNEAIVAMLTDPGQQVNGFDPAEQLAKPITDILEIGPHCALKGPLRSITENVAKSDAIRYASMLKRLEHALENVLDVAGSLWARGFDVDLGAANHIGSEIHTGRMLTDLPGYSFDHSIEYWFEGRLSRESRFPRVGRHELLGAPIPDWNKAHAIWRHRISMRENPWLEDHKISGNILYPGAGMLVMAIEASRQLCDPEKTVKGFTFKDVSFHRALRVPDTPEGIEAQFHLRPCLDDMSTLSSAWNAFQLFTLEGDEWIEHFHGYIQTDYDEETDNLEEREAQPLPAFSDRTRGMKSVSVKRIYSIMKEAGNDFGPLFRTLEESWMGPSLNTISKVKNPVSRVREQMPYRHLQNHLVHPAFLDGVIQVNLVPLILASQRLTHAFVPYHLKELWISAKSPREDVSYAVSADCQRRGTQKVESSFTAACADTGELMVKGDGFVMKAVPTHAPFQRHKNSAFHISWKPDPTFTDPRECIHDKLKQCSPPRPLLTYECLAIDYMRSLLETDIAKQNEKLPRHLQLYMSYVRHAVEEFESMPVEYSVGELEQSPDGALIVAVGKALPQILSGEIDPLEVFFNTKLVEDFYQHAFGAERCFSQLCSYLEVLVHKNPAMKFLEIGAGTGGTTRSIMKSLSQNGQRYQEYVFTDVSPAFFEEARKVFENNLGRMNFRVLDIEKDPQNQGFESGQYDVIVAANVLHATKNIDLTLCHARSLLKPGGKLLLYEATNPASASINIVFGTLPGWWLSEEPERSRGPLMTTSTWDTHLKATGFTGVDAVFNDYPDLAEQVCSVMISSATEADKVAAKPDTVVLVVGDNSSTQKAVADNLTVSLADACSVKTFALEELANEDLIGATCVFLPELDTPLLRNTTTESFASIKHMVQQCRVLLWAGRLDPDCELVTGLARTVRNENPGLKFITVSFEDDVVPGSVAEKTALILHEARQGLTDNTFRVANTIAVPRVIEESPISQHVHARVHGLDVAEVELAAGTSPLCLQIGRAGKLDELRFEDDLLYETPLGAHEVEFSMQATHINLRDLATAMGQIDDDSVFGLEASGIVTRTGPGAKFNIGDRVFGMSVSGTIKTHVRTCDAFLALVPETMSWAEAAPISLAYSTAYAVLHEFGSIRESSTILIHDAAEALGQAAIQLAQLKGADVFVTADTTDKLAFLERSYRIPHNHVYLNRGLSFKEGIQQMTNSRGIDIVLNTLSGDAFQASWECVAPFGRFVDFGSKNLSEKSSLSLRSVGRNVRFESFDFLYLMRHDPTYAERIFQDTIKFVIKNNLWRLTPFIRYPLSKISDAFREMQGHAHTERLILEHTEHQIVPILPSQKPRTRFDPEASYVIVGGLGGLGQSISHWMVTAGARNLILLSRTGAVRDDAKDFVEELKTAGCNVATPACDAADREALRRTIDGCRANMPKIKGCIQSSMVLKDNRFDHMSLDDWNAAIRAKVDASWNLHHVFDEDLDFFILFSSMMGVMGNMEQSNYSAGNTFLDALARYRVLKGMPALVLDLPVIDDLGFVAEKPELLESMRAAGFDTMSAEEIHAVLDYHCATPQENTDVETCQVVLRPGIPQELKAKGMVPPAWMDDPLFSHLAQIETENATEQTTVGQEVKHATLLAGAPSKEEAIQIVLDALLLKLTRVLSIALANLDPTKPLHAYGVDSLVAVDVRSWLLKELGSELSIFDMTSQPNILRLAETAATKSRFMPVFEGAAA